MPRFLLSPAWLLFHVATVAVVVGFVILGSWQFSAFRDSDARHDTRASDPVALDDVAAVGELVDDAGDTPVTVTGTFLSDEQRRVPGRVHDGILGSYLMTPLKTADGTIVPIIRGWVDDPESAAVADTAEVTITGHLLPPETREHATVRTGVPLESDEVAYVAPQQIAHETGIPEDSMIGGYVLASEPTKANGDDVVVLSVDIVAPIRDVNPWQNLSYWAQWWVFAIAALIFWVSAVRSAIRRRRQAVSEPEQSPVLS